jgi:hypothetical protein
MVRSPSQLLLAKYEILKIRPLPTIVIHGLVHVRASGAPADLLTVLKMGSTMGSVPPDSDFAGEEIMT